MGKQYTVISVLVLLFCAGVIKPRESTKSWKRPLKVAYKEAASKLINSGLSLAVGGHNWLYISLNHTF